MDEIAYEEAIRKELRDHFWNTYLGKERTERDEGYEEGLTYALDLFIRLSREGVAGGTV